jgi:hypothetical protein
MNATQITFAHELGHNLGCAHAWNDTEKGSNSNTGWRFKDSTLTTKYTTIMAYYTGWTSGRIPYYSNPDVFYDGGRTGAVPGYNATGDASVDPKLYNGGGFNGTIPTLGADNANTIDTGNGIGGAGATVASNWATRTAFGVITTPAAVRWEKGNTYSISYTGGDHQGLVNIRLYKGGVLHTTFASNLNPASLRTYDWTVPFSIAAGSDYMIRVELTSNGSTITADSGIFEIFSDPPHVKSGVTNMAPANIGFVSGLILRFNVPMDPATFSQISDIVSFTNPSGASVASSITSATWSSENTILTIAFPPPTVPGTYQLVLGSDIRDSMENLLDQDLDGNPGETIDDRFTLNFVVPPPLVYYASMDTDPGWTFSANNPVNGWAYGQPTGAEQDGWGGPDPTSGFNGPKVMGYNLSGDYENSIAAGATRWATTPVMDCSNHENVTLKFQRWFGSDSFAGYGVTYPGDESYIEVSNNGTNWTRIWQNPNVEAWDTNWVQVEYNISAIVDRQPTVYVRWGMGRTDSSFRYSGWNIDEVIVLGDYLAPPPANIFSNWISSFDVGALTAPGDDGDGDGVPNAVENYFGTNPSNFSAGLSSFQVTTGGSRSFSFKHPINQNPASDLSVSYRWSKDLSTFYNSGQADPSGTTVTCTVGTPAGGEVTVTAAVTGTGSDRVFVTVSVTQN